VCFLVAAADDIAVGGFHLDELSGLVGADRSTTLRRAAPEGRTGRPGRVNAGERCGDHQADG